jgi:hypothetical protein
MHNTQSFFGAESQKPTANKWRGKEREHSHIPSNTHTTTKKCGVESGAERHTLVWAKIEDTQRIANESNMRDQKKTKAKKDSAQLKTRTSVVSKKRAEPSRAGQSR